MYSRYRYRTVKKAETQPSSVLFLFKFQRLEEMTETLPPKQIEIEGKILFFWFGFKMKGMPHFRSFESVVFFPKVLKSVEY